MKGHSSLGRDGRCCPYYAFTWLMTVASAIGKCTLLHLWMENSKGGQGESMHVAIMHVAIWHSGVT